MGVMTGFRTLPDILHTLSWSYHEISSLEKRRSLLEFRVHNTVCLIISKEFLGFYLQIQNFKSYYEISIIPSILTIDKL